MKTLYNRALSLRLPEYLYQRIRKAAFDNETSITKFVRKTLEEKVINNTEHRNANP